MIGRTTTVLGALAAAPTSFALAWHLYGLLEGRVVYDVGVGVADHPDRALAGGLILILVVNPLMLWLLGRARNRYSLALWVGIPWMLVWVWLFAFIAPLG